MHLWCVRRDAPLQAVTCAAVGSSSGLCERWCALFSSSGLCELSLCAIGTTGRMCCALVATLDGSGWRGASGARERASVVAVSGRVRPAMAPSPEWPVGARWVTARRVAMGCVGMGTAWRVARARGRSATRSSAASARSCAARLPWGAAGGCRNHHFARSRLAGWRRGAAVWASRAIDHRIGLRTGWGWGRRARSSRSPPPQGGGSPWRRPAAPCPPPWGVPSRPLSPPRWHPSSSPPLPALGLRSAR